MQEIFGEQDAYRIGGDEFVAAGTDLELAQLESLTARLRRNVEQCGYSAAVGYAAMPASASITALIQDAEQKMYADKNVYYSRIGEEYRRKV